MPRGDTGLTSQDAQTDFARARRRAALSRLAARLRRERGDIDMILPFEEVVEALGRVGERDLGLQSIPLDSIVGTVGRTRDFDRSFRPTSGRTRQRWERMAGAQRRGESFPPISVYRIGELHFVRDGHHRVSVARAQGLTHIDAYATEVRTKVGADAGITLADLPVKSHVRLFMERVPLSVDRMRRIRLSDEWQYGQLAEGIEAWGFRRMQEHRELMSREEVARAWFDDEYAPVIEMLREADLIGPGTETEAYLRVAAERYRLMLTHSWSDEVIERLRRELR